jgi:hypothetical protein
MNEQTLETLAVSPSQAAKIIGLQSARRTGASDTWVFPLLKPADVFFIGFPICRIGLRNTNKPPPVRRSPQKCVARQTHEHHTDLTVTPATVQIGMSVSARGGNQRRTHD